MDTLRGPFADHDGPSNEASGLEDDSIAGSPPAPIAQDERRMQVRAYNFWASLLDDCHFPRIETLQPETLDEFGPYSVLLDFTRGIDNPEVSFLGDRLASECGAQGVIRALSDVPSRSLLSRITDHYMQILANQAPIGFEAEFVNQRGITILYRGILLPFSSDDATIDYIYGVINWKELADQQATDELMLEMDQTLEPMPLRRHDPLQLTDWADGPAEFAAGPDQDEMACGLSFGGPELPAGASENIPDASAMVLADWLHAARALAAEAQSSEDRSRHALYAALGRAHDFALAAAEAPAEFAAMVEDAGLTVQERAPLTPLVKLVFGAHYDKTRLTEYATAIGHAQRLGLERGSFGDYLGQAPGGLKAIVAEERRLRRAEAGRDATPNREPREALLRRLRDTAPMAIDALSGEGEEFTLLVARRLDSGEVVLVGEVADDPALFERAARKLLG
ncbi:hypothetical protein B2G71_13800 [Novosphingobium sp. PC22D]|uniref:hypothetical protein n=1 Tax=Novosphingobium sp. PC22D TaxID=1962403 RepID=UPI000BEF90E7|nr:hypothetical protein [Novosphingobium sp. PC22D]PEQ12201.1 hypothetical protein B2G71_13800 [Novosphingobium sp. PC22D]